MTRGLCLVYFTASLLLALGLLQLQEVSAARQGSSTTTTTTTQRRADYRDAYASAIRRGDDEDNHYDEDDEDDDDDDDADYEDFDEENDYDTETSGWGLWRERPSFGVGGYDIIVGTGQGYLGGARGPRTFVFGSVPYAKPPVGARRFAPPSREAPEWNGVRNATGLPLACMQPATVAQSEDCLYLTIYVPLSFQSDSRAYRDVVIYWHGGAFRTGSQSSFVADYIANHTDVVVVVAQYRLGVLALLGHEAFLYESGTFGNYGIQDQQATMRWVREHIRAFGGHPRKVSISGQSAGAIATQIHAVAPASRGLYKRALAYSGVGYSGPLLPERDWIVSNMRSVIEGLGCATLPGDGGGDWSSSSSCNASRPGLSRACAAQIRACIRAAPASAFIDIQRQLPDFVKPRPAVDGIVIPDQPIKLIERNRFYRVPTLLGSMVNESNVLVIRQYPGFTATQADFNKYVSDLFGPEAVPTFAQLYPVSNNNNNNNYYEAIARLDTDWYYVCPTLKWLDTLASVGFRQAYLYRWSYVGSWYPANYGSWHVGDVVYMTQQGCVTVLNTPCVKITPETYPDDAQVAREFQLLVWAAFAKNGRPAIAGLKPYAVDGSYLDIAGPGNFIARKYSEHPFQREQCEYINSFVFGGNNK